MDKRFFPLIFVGLLCFGCGGGKGSGGAVEPGFRKEAADVSPPGETGLSPLAAEKTAPALEDMAELERAGVFIPGLALLESSLREKAGDYGGAVIAAFKESAWAFGQGKMGREEMEKGIEQVARVFRGEGGETVQEIRAGEKQRSEAVQAAEGILAFLRGDWEEAEELLTLFAAREEADGFSRWMLLVCFMEKSLERGERAGEIRSSYGAIRARYSRFPEYWFRAARAFSAREYSPGVVAGRFPQEYAEQCINLSPRGPFANECREILAGNLGLSLSEGRVLMSMAEIDDIVRSALSSEKPEILGDLFPLMALPDNVYTLYALGILKNAAARPSVKDFLEAEAGRSGGRLAERLRFTLQG